MLFSKNKKNTAAAFVEHRGSKHNCKVKFENVTYLSEILTENEN